MFGSLLSFISKLFKPNARREPDTDKDKRIVEEYIDIRPPDGLTPYINKGVLSQPGKFVFGVSEILNITVDGLGQLPISSIYRRPNSTIVLV